MSPKLGESGEEKNFFSREKKFFSSPEPPSLFKKSGVFVEGMLVFEVIFPPVLRSLVRRRISAINR